MEGKMAEEVRRYRKRSGEVRRLWKRAERHMKVTVCYTIPLLQSHFTISLQLSNVSVNTAHDPSATINFMDKSYAIYNIDISLNQFVYHIRQAA